MYINLTPGSNTPYFNPVKKTWLHRIFKRSFGLVHPTSKEAAAAPKKYPNFSSLELSWCGKILKKCLVFMSWFYCKYKYLHYTIFWKYLNLNLNSKCMREYFFYKNYCSYLRQTNISHFASLWYFCAMSDIPDQT